MPGFDALVRLFAALDGLLERCEPAPWGAIVTDARLPRIYDANYARVDGTTDVSLAEVEGLLLPELERSGARFAHVVALDPEATPRLVADMRGRGRQMTLDTVMRAEPTRAVIDADHAVDEAHPGEGLWTDLRASLPEFDIKDEETIDQVVRWQRDVLAPNGKRWFAVRMDGSTAGIGSLFVRGDVGYIDDVVTRGRARRRGVGGSIVRHMLRLAAEQGTQEVYLLADQPGPIRLYERLGFSAVGEVVGALRPLP